MKCFYFSVALIFAIQIFSQVAFSTLIWLSPVMSIFPPKFSPRSTMSGFNKYYLLYSQNDSDSNPNRFLSLSCYYGSSYIVMNFASINAFPIESHKSKNTPYFHQLVLSSLNFWGLTWFNMCPLRFIKPNKYPFNTISFQYSLVRPHHRPLNELNFTWYYVFEIRSLIN